MRKQLGTLMLVLGALMLAGCPKPDQTAQQGEGESAAKTELLILCGTSFRPPTEKLVEMFEKEHPDIDVLLSFGGSEDHLPHVQAKAQGDLYVTHDPYMQYTEEAGAMLRWVQVGYLCPVLVVQKGNPKNIQSIEDLTKEGIQVALPNPDYSTCGEMVFALLEKKGIKDAVLKNVGNAMFRSHADIGKQLKLGHADAGIMWNGVANEYLDAIDIVPTPYEYDEQIRVGVIGLSYTKHPDEVEAFLKFAEEHGQEVFKESGYLKYEPEADSDGDTPAAE
ncbi:molybdate ABC transporter substrate-binding protein [Thermostilla marina]